MFVCIILLCLGFSYWLVSETEVERARNFYVEYGWIRIQEKHKEADKLYEEVLARGGDEPIDQVWHPLVLSQEDGYDKLINYSRLLAGDTEREATYAEIYNLIERSPKEFRDNLKVYYLIELQEIPHVRIDLLRQHNLWVAK